MQSLRVKPAKDTPKKIPLAVAANEVMSEGEVEEFLPYACHYDETTLLTKNGELMQMIKLTGFNFESIETTNHERLSVRDAVRRAITENIKDNKFALWIHTVRRRRNLATGGEYREPFADKLNRAWIAHHDWTHKYMNELYITILVEGQSLALKDIRTFFRSLIPGIERKHRLAYLDQMASKLRQTTDGIVESLRPFGAYRLEAHKGSDGIYYSEPLQFLGKIINLAEEPFAMTMENISEVMPARHQVFFGFNALEVKGKTGKHFGVILTVKEYHEMTAKHIDAFLQLPYRFVITETFDFINNTKALEHFKKQHDYHVLAKDKEIERISGLEDIISSDTGSITDFGEHQISILLLDDELEHLEQGVSAMVAAFQKLGIVVFREDLFLEDCFWAQLPGNFEFVKRMSFINTRHVGGYASLYNFPAGKLAGNHWGPAVTVFYTAQKTPYFFNFHYVDNGHTAIIGPQGAGKTVLLNFLLSEARKFNPRLFFLDRERGSEIFIKALGGQYRKIAREADATQLRFNPLLLPDTKENRSFLRALLSYMMADNPAKIEADQKEKIASAVERVFTLPETERRLSTLLPEFWPPPEKAKLREILDQLLQGEKGVPVSTAERMSVWYGEGGLAHIFDNEKDEVDLRQGLIHGFCMTHMVEDGISLIPVLAYLFHRIRHVLDGSPTMLVLDEAWHLIDNPVFAPLIAEWMDEFRAKNTIVILATESAEDAGKSSITGTLMQKVQTSIFLPNPKAGDAYGTVFGLSEEEVQFIQTMSSKKRQFLLKHHIDSVVAELDLGEMEDLLAVLSGTPQNVALLEGIIAETGPDPEKWLEPFMAKVAA